MEDIYNHTCKGRVKADSERSCVAQWGCRRPNSISEDWRPWSLLKNIKRSEDKDKLTKAGCINEHEMNDNIDGYRLGALERSPEKDVNNFPVFWVQITPNSRTCPIDLYGQGKSEFYVDLSDYEDSICD